MGERKGGLKEGRGKEGRKEGGRKEGRKGVGRELRKVTQWRCSSKIKQDI